MLEKGALLDGKYRILDILGSGGMSVVYLAVNERANKHWAVKEIRKDPGPGRDVSRRSLIAEIEVLRNLRHSCLPRIVDVIDSEDAYMIVMDYIRGETLADLLRKQEAFSQQDVLRWAVQLCSVLMYLHSREPPVIYRDMKPANIMLKSDGDIVLIDFGTAREMKEVGGRDTMYLGTRGYAAPEQYGGAGQTDARTDIYCLGSTLYHLLTGHDPAGPPYRMLPVRRWNPALSPGLEQIILRCTREDPGERYQSCQELMHDLEHYERLDREYLSDRRLRLRIFAAVCLITWVLAIGTLSAGLYHHALLRQDYLSCLEEAESARGFSEMRELVREAVRMDRSAPEAYQLMLSWITADRCMTDEEKAALEDLLYERRSGCRNITHFRRHKKAYAEFSYNMGLACFFYYKGSRGKSIAGTWFQDLDHAPLSRDKRTRAEIYVRIGRYYPTLAGHGQAGEERAGGYPDYYKDLSSLNAFSPKMIGNPGTALTLYCEIAGQIGTHARDFLDEDVTSEELIAELHKISRYAQDSCMKEVKEEDRNNLARIVHDAMDKVEAAARAITIERYEEDNCHL